MLSSFSSNKYCSTEELDISKWRKEMDKQDKTMVPVWLNISSAQVSKGYTLIEQCSFGCYGYTTQESGQEDMFMLLNERGFANEEAKGRASERASQV